MKQTIKVITLGCPKNDIDTEIMLGSLNKQGYNIVANAEDADIIIINTCAFIETSKQQSINTIIKYGKLKETGQCKKLIVTGCLSQRYKQELLDGMPEIDGLLGTGEYHRIGEVIKKSFAGEKSCIYSEKSHIFDESIGRYHITPIYTSYIKISEGCNNRCSYCIIPSIRGPYVSRTIESVYKEVQDLVNRGTKEIILVSQDCTRYGIDLYGEYRLIDLLKSLGSIKDLKWIRLLYCYPDIIDDDLILAIANNDKVCKYIDIPIQHINDGILKSMNRKTTSGKIIQVINRFRELIPDIIIRSTLIVGFPGETQQQFDELYSFVKEIEIDRLGVFMYSREENTLAYKMKNQVDKTTKLKRYDKIMSVQQAISNKKNNQRIGRTYQVLVEEMIEEGLYSGRSYAESPDIDGIIFIRTCYQHRPGDLIKVRIVEAYEYDLMGEEIYESGK
ncbi:MAG: 30S ribosomal protein S12 methylthiotransferase RimO [Clostridia bacterium]|nr:30S ribosomal protein S12 methylthiotransferase RimO [Clostridia bacterium]